MNEELKKLLSKPVASIPDAGRVAFDLCRNAAYAAAKRGEIETIEFGGKKVVPTTWIRKKLGLEVAA
ncbi:DNA-binding protein [Bradyrhizobium barranii]|uniref:DNA-binding protein n=1 Tax=Bradyrhizobium barranii TaxID=2992140 RepID=A0ABY3QB34_9BRAD|nr:DNA-binding protein [Bradyrhizobium japonicum]UFW82856.1 DNA-binding protein [Bradyrhizobium japonicum]